MLLKSSAMLFAPVSFNDGLDAKGLSKFFAFAVALCQTLCFPEMLAVQSLESYEHR